MGNKETVKYLAMTMIMAIILTAVTPYITNLPPVTPPPISNGKLGEGSAGNLKYIKYKLSPSICLDVVHDIWLGGDYADGKTYKIDLKDLLGVNVVNYTIDKIEIEATVGYSGVFCSGGYYEIKIFIPTDVIYHRSGSIPKSTYEIEDSSLVSITVQGSLLEISSSLYIQAYGLSGYAYLSLRSVVVYITAYYMEG